MSAQDRQSGDAARYAERVSMVLAGGKTGVWSWMPQSRSLNQDARIAAIWGVPASQTAGMEQLLDAVHPDDRARVDTAIDRMLDPTPDTDRGGEIQFRIRRIDDGRERWVSARAGIFPSPDDAVGEVIGTAEDVTDQKLHDIHLHMLLREITHRSKNLLAIIQAMARQTVKDSLTAADFERRLSLRLRGLAASHELLAAQDWHGAHMEELVKGQLHDMLESHPSRVSLGGASIFLKPEAAQNIGLALNELSTNAIRYGALSNSEGRVELSWHLDDGTGADRRLHVTWTELGGPTVAPPRRQGFGRKVVERVAASALDGSVSLTFAPEGLQWSLRIPSSFVLSGPPKNAEMPKLFSA
ncbi:HWE histidine kinase domain-containing protein [Lichenihabitans sp. Uapishka_5]|uniref:sensor histidine kinase n=1 Tax=Lichenihabitans sp. Uapishka_5 TaxID=3037302 RepID=UPI0029E7FBBD|nr:HWE histidine kinase domain-containing protein [Lichenihabitans sp. Uapishka_5]MDX7952505.1 HWE histidine kinase domain-containing protein [Lichenihabitans sp. Uapishka_5]